MQPTAIAATSSPQLATVIDRLMSLDIDDDEVYHISDVVGAVAEAKRAVAGATDTTAVMQEWLIIEDDIDQAEANRDDYLDEMDEQAKPDIVGAVEVHMKGTNLNHARRRAKTFGMAHVCHTCC